jgi:hypothetical protein
MTTSRARAALLPQVLPLVLALALAPLAAAPAVAWKVDPNASPDDFHAFHRRFASDAYAYPRHGAAPLGLVGFEIWADATYDDGFDDEPFAGTAIDGDLSGGFLSVGRVGVRKGLPGGLDLGVSYGRALGGDVKLVSGEVQYALLKGGALSPALSVRVTGSRTVDARAYDLDQWGAELLASKGFAVLTPYLGAGLVRSQGTLSGGVDSLSETETRGLLYGGVTLNLLLPKITVELEKADEVQGAVRVGFGF